jgi:hypothetical protein
MRLSTDYIESSYLSYRPLFSCFTKPTPELVPDVYGITEADVKLVLHSRRDKLEVFRIDINVGIPAAY